MSQIQISHLHFSYDGHYETIFEDVSLTLDTGWRLGLIGRNGKGKTTLLRILMGWLDYRGTVSASESFAYFPYEPENPEDSGLEVALGIHPQLEDWELLRELSLLDVDSGVLYRPYETLSPGEQTKLLLAVLFLKPEHFLLIDEPTNHLDMPGREKVAGYLRSKKGFILVSHDRNFLDSCIDHVLSINNADITLEQGTFSSWLLNKQRREMFERRENIRLQGEIRQLDEAARRSGVWSDRVEASKTGQGHVDRGYIGAKSAKMMKRAKAIQKRSEKAAEEKSRLLHNVDRTFELAIHPLTYFKPVLASAVHFSFGFGRRTLQHDLTFSLEREDRLALIGPNGSGKSTMIRFLTGEYPAQAPPDFWMNGEFSVGSRMKISYMPQDTSRLMGDLSGFARNRQLDEPLFRAILNKLAFPAAQFDKPLESYSAGQKKKVLLAMTLCEEADLYIWDEPLNYIDVLSRLQIEALLQEYRPTLVFVEHDKAFVDHTAAKTILFGSPESDR